MDGSRYQLTVSRRVKKWAVKDKGILNSRKKTTELGKNKKGE